MAIAKLSQILETTAQGLSKVTQARLPKKSHALHTKRSGASCILAETSQKSPSSLKGKPYQKDLFCYADQLYRDRDNDWVILWADYYRYVKQITPAWVYQNRKLRSTYSFDKSKDIGRHALWIKTILTDRLNEFNALYIHAVWAITDVTLEGQTVKFTGQLTAEEPQFLVDTFFNFNLSVRPRF